MSPESPLIKRRCLIIEDEASVARFLEISLREQGFDIRIAETAAMGHQAAIEFRPELVILDLGLPDRDGADLLLDLRKWMTVPILVLTARETDEDKVRALDRGADDYLTKPFSLAELQARIRVALRHADRIDAVTTVYRTGEWEMDFSAHTIKFRGALLKLTSTEYDILKVLVRSTGKVVTHRVLLKEIWGPNSVEHTQYLRVYVGQLRKKLRTLDSASEFIQTEPGVGYRWMGVS